MIRCEQAERLFDAYADGTLSPSWTAELHAHQLECTGCRRELALMRVCGDVIATDRREPQPSADFTNQVMTAWGPPPSRVLPWPRRVARMMVGFGTAAAAALVALVIFVPREAPQLPLDVTGTSAETAVAGATVQFEDVVTGGTQNLRTLGHVGTVLLYRMLERTDETVRDAFVSGSTLDVSKVESLRGAIDALPADRSPAADAGSTP